MVTTLRKRIREAGSGDDGALLVLALIFILIIAFVVTGILSETSTTFGAATVTRQYVTKYNAADAGLRFGLQQVRANTEACTPGSTIIQPPSGFFTSDGTATGNPAPANQPFPSVTVSCSVDADQQIPGVNGYALITHDPSSQGFNSGNHNLTVKGPVFMGNDPNSVSLIVKQANAYTVGTPPSCPAEPSGLQLSPGFSWNCQPVVPDNNAPTLPTNAFLTSSTSMPTRTGPVANPGGNCAVFAPGKYSNMTMPLNTGNGNNPGQNYFASGVYYLDNVTIDVSNAIVFAGAPHTGKTYLGDEYDETSALTAFNSSYQPCSGDSVANAATGNDGTVNGTGVKFILGGNSSILVDNPKGYLELYARYVPYAGSGPNTTAKAQAATEGTQGVSVMSVPASTASPWDAMPLGYSSLCFGQGNANGGGGSHMGLATHGEVYVPQCFTQVRDNLDVAQFTGGLDLGRLTISSSANVSSFLISVEDVKVPVAMTITSCVTMSGVTPCTASSSDGGGRSVVGIAHVSVDNVQQAVTVTSWRID